MENTDSIRIWQIGYLLGNKTVEQRVMGVPMPKYLVGFSDSESPEQDVKMIEASSENEAIDKFIQVFAIGCWGVTEQILDVRPVNPFANVLTSAKSAQIRCIGHKFVRRS